MSSPAGSAPAIANGDQPRDVVLGYSDVVSPEFVGLGAVGAAVAGSLSFSQPNVKAAQRQALAERFAHLVANLQSVEEVWLDATLPDLRLTVIMRELDFEREIEVRGIFINLANEADEADASLSVFALDDDVPDWAREGELLT